MNRRRKPNKLLRKLGGNGGGTAKRKRAFNKRGAWPYPSFCRMSLPSSRLTGTPAHDGVKLIEEEEAGGGL